MKITATEGEPTVFLVESRTVQCNKCLRKFSNNPKAIRGQSCPQCLGGVLKAIMPHKVDVAELFPIGECQCKGFQLQRRKEVEQMESAKRLLLSFSEQERLRCPHIKAARNFCLNRDLFHYELRRLNK